MDDTCRALDLVLHAPAELVEGEVFNVGSNKHRAILSIAEDITATMCRGKECTIHIGNRPGLVMRHTCDASKIKRVLGWKPEVAWKDGLPATIQWYKDNEDWWRRMLWMRMKVEFYRHALNEDDIQAVAGVLRSIFLTTGPAAAFEQKFSHYTGLGFTVSLNSCTAALLAGGAAPAGHYRRHLEAAGG